MRAVLRPLLAVVFALTLCLGPISAVTSAQTPDTKLQVVTTFSVLYDIIQNVGGDRVSVHSMVPLGTDPHEYTPLPLDIRKTADADIVFWNGLNMETGDGWFEKLMSVAGKDIEKGPVYALSEGVEPMYLTDGRGVEINPHAFLDVQVGIKFVENARDALMTVDPDHAHVYEANAAAYIAQLEAIDEKYRDLISTIPQERRILVTSERAFQYMAATYGLREGYIWQIDTEEQGTPMQLMQLINFIKDNAVKILFVESNVDPRPMERVSRDTRVPIFEDRLYADELGRKGTPGETYLGMLDWNIDVIYRGLMQH